jgi:flagellar assembly protein FliH
MMSMSKVISSKTREDCKPWCAPNLNVSEESVFDYKLTEPEKITHRNQQQKIRQQAYEKSYAKGYMEGLEQGQREIGVQLEYLQSIMATLAMPLPGFDDQLVDEMVQLSMSVVKQMVRRELKSSPGEVVAVIKEAISILPATSTDVILELNPEDAELVRNALMKPDIESNWKINVDPVLTRGGCRVLTKSSRIDATVEARLNAVIASVLGDERMQDSPG